MAQKLYMCYEANKMKLQSNSFRIIRYFNILHPNFWEIAFPHRPPISAPCLISNQTVYFFGNQRFLMITCLKLKLLFIQWGLRFQLIKGILQVQEVLR